MSQLDKEVQKQAIKEAMREFLEEKSAQFGWFTLRWLGAALLTVVVYLLCKMKGIL